MSPDPPSQSQWVVEHQRFTPTSTASSFRGADNGRFCGSSSADAARKSQQPKACVTTRRLLGHIISQPRHRPSLWLLWYSAIVQRSGGHHHCQNRLRQMTCSFQSTFAALCPYRPPKCGVELLMVSWKQLYFFFYVFYDVIDDWRWNDRRPCLSLIHI